MLLESSDKYYLKDSSYIEYDNITIEEIYRFVTKGTKYNGLEQLEIIEEAKVLFKIKYNRYFSEK